MNPSQDPFSHAPISRPDGTLPPMAPPPPVDRSDWKNAPSIVRSVRILNLLAVILYVLLTIALVVGLSSGGGSRGAATSIGYIVVMVICGGLQGWLIHGLRQGTPAAWVVQIVVSALGLLNCPVGTLINAYILSQWFKPDVKAWFGQS